MREERIYRSWVGGEDLVKFRVVETETDLLISAERDLSKEAMDSIKRYRDQIKDYIVNDPKFESSLEPIEIKEDAPPIVKDMARQAKVANVGPMAAVAGAVAEYVGKDLLRYSAEVIVENGGDIFIKSSKPRTVAIYAGSSPLTGKIALKISADQMPLGVCTSSGTVGHSISFGKADSVTALSESTSLADAVATATCNLVKDEGDIERGIRFARKFEGIKGVAIIVGDRIGAWGDFEVIPVGGSDPSPMLSKRRV